MKVVLHVFENAPNGPLEKAATAAHAESFDIEGVWSSYAGTQGTAQAMAKLGLTFPSIAVARDCGNGKLKYFAQLPGLRSVQSIMEGVAAALKSPLANCSTTGQEPLPSTGPGTGNDNEQSGSGLNPFGLFSLPFDFPWWIWAAIAGGAAVASSSSNGKVGAYGWGGIAVVASGNAINAYNKSNG